ncbi:hypothetical protein SAMN05216248_11126 [Pseudomonas simiae]|uniref:hypothetical protein n=1 Tax=Pseudomonas simiae TaxID=321846 RepID=UPI0008EB3CF1|nr:hypothetical protein [Pseudomonas simiae]SFB54285.1 hypothetical protein SAMN05216248_11126 [Pseudomonas simiae]
MKNQQDNFPSLPALLCAADSVDTLETNSLCCAAAGIIAPSSATAEALIPHEKLRGAALADATLNAQERLPAQPAVGYKAELKALMSIHGVGRQTAGRIHAAGFRLTDSNGVHNETQVDAQPICHIGLKDLEYIQGGTDRHAVVRSGAVSKYKVPLYTRSPCGTASHADNEASIAAIQFALSAEEGMTFLRIWNEGEFNTIREEWPEAPEEVFIGADPLYVREQRV